MNSYLGLALLATVATFCSANADKRHGLKQVPSSSLVYKADTQALLNARSALLVEDVLNLASVIRFSHIEGVRKEHDKIYCRVYGFDLEKDSLRVNQQRDVVILLRKLDFVSDGKVPCYVFHKLMVTGDTAEVQLTFPMTGLLAFGKLHYKDGHWHPTKEFIAGRT